MVLSRVAHVLLATALFAALPANAQTPSNTAATQPAADAASKTIPSLPSDSDSSKDEPSLAERLLTSPREPRCDADGTIGGITVCGKKKDSAKDRLPVPNSLRAATDLHDALATPDVSGTNKLTGGLKFHLCLVGGCPMQMLPDINFKALPAAPEGSDADKIAKGEMRAP
jgi:hypothetical protein